MLFLIVKDVELMLPQCSLFLPGWMEVGTRKNMCSEKYMLISYKNTFYKNKQAQISQTLKNGLRVILRLIHPKESFLNDTF